MAAAEPITAEDLAALVEALEDVDRADLEALTDADLGTLDPVDAVAVAAAANAVFGLLDLLTQRDGELGAARASVAEITRQLRPQKQANGAQLFRAPRKERG